MRFKNITPVKPKHFEPIELTITLESADDLRYLAAALNLHPKSIRKAEPDYLQYGSIDKSRGFSELWQLLDTAIEQRNLNR